MHRTKFGNEYGCPRRLRQTTALIDYLPPSEIRRNMWRASPHTEAYVAWSRAHSTYGMRPLEFQRPQCNGSQRPPSPAKRCKLAAKRRRARGKMAVSSPKNAGKLTAKRRRASRKMRQSSPEIAAEFARKAAELMAKRRRARRKTLQNSDGLCR